MAGAARRQAWLVRMGLCVLRPAEARMGGWRGRTVEVVSAAAAAADGAADTFACAVAAPVAAAARTGSGVPSSVLLRQQER